MTTFNNYFIETRATFRGCSTPKRKPDYKSASGSLYWYGTDRNGKYVIRYSDHWLMRNRIYSNNLISTYAPRECKRIASCLWKLKTNKLSNCGKCYLNDFTKK